MESVSGGKYDDVSERKIDEVSEEKYDNASEEKYDGISNEKYGQLSKILTAIGDEGDSEAARILASAEKEADELRRLYDEQIEEVRKDIMLKAEIKAEEVKRSGRSQASGQRGSIRLAAKRQALEKAFFEAEQELAGMPDAKKKGFYEKLISACSIGNNVMVRLNEQDKKRVGKKLKVAGKTLKIEETPGSFKGGLIIREADTETICTFEALIADAAKELEPEIAAILFS